MDVAGTRLEITLNEPNPLFIKWLERWLADAEQRNAKSKHKLLEALQALRSYPLPLYSGRECSILRGFGTTLCNQIDEELQLFYSGKHLAHSSMKLSAKNNESYTLEVQQVVEEVKKKQQSKKKQQQQQQVIAKKTKKAIELANMEEMRQRQVVMNSGAFKIMLLVDTQETSGKNKRVLDQTRSYLESLGVPYEVRRLTVGDFLWIAHDTDGNELVLPYIIERKRMDDLASSIRDGRFHEQKHRLRQSGIQNVIYLIEDYGDNEQLGLPLESLQQAIVNTYIHAGFTIVRTVNQFRSIVFLQSMTRSLVRQFKDKILMSTNKDVIRSWRPSDGIVSLLKFRDLYENSSRNAQLTVREVFVQQLVQLHSLSLEKALAIVTEYSTPRALFDAYEACNSTTEARSMLAAITCGRMERPLGLKISQCIYDFYKTEF